MNVAQLITDDKQRYHCRSLEADAPGLGANPRLAPLNRKSVRHQLSFMDPNSFAERQRAVRLLLQRIRDYYACIGYVGPYLTKYSELGYGLGEWIIDGPQCSPRRNSFCEGHGNYRDNVQKVFFEVRFSSFQLALHIAAWEFTQEVPESAEAIKRASWLAYQVIQQLCGAPWSTIRGRRGSKAMRKVLFRVINEFEHYQVVPGSRWLGLLSKVHSII